MFSKRIAICLYRGINKQAGIVQSCYGCITQRNVFVRTWSDDRTNVSTVKTCQVTDEHEEGKSHLLITKKSRILLKEHETIPDAEEFAKGDKSVVSKQFENDFNIHGDAEDNDRSEVKSQNDLPGQITSRQNEDDTASGMTIINREITEKDGEEETSLSQVVKREFQPSFNMAPYVNESPTLSNLVKIGVSLADIEKREGAADIIIKLDFEKDVQPFLLFLKDVGVDDENIGRVITKNPYLLKEDLQDLKARINYLRSKNFSTESVSSIVTRNPYMLSMRVERVDAKLGFYQKEFKLTGTDIRKAITKCPLLITKNKEIMKRTILYIADNLGFTKWEMKQIFITTPRVYIKHTGLLGPNFDFLHNVMGLSHKDILLWPQIFLTRTFIIEQRHRYLVSLGRAQYNPKKENYISLRDLVRGSDADFCENVAKSSVEQFNEFVKTI